MSILNSTVETVINSARQVYTNHLRVLLAKQFLGRDRMLTRQELLEDSPSYLKDFYFADKNEVVTLTEPSSVGPLPNNIREKIGEWTFDRPFVATLQDVQLVGPDALPIAPDGRYVLEAADGSSQRVSDGLVRTLVAGDLPIRQGSVDRTLKTAVSLAGPWSEEFFHWFADYLPRLRLLNWLEKSKPPLLLPADPPKWLTDSLNLLGVSQDRRLSWTGGRTTVERLIVPSLPRHTESTAPKMGYVHSPRALSWVAEEIRDAVDDSDRPNVGRRLYVSRSRQDTRTVMNQDIYHEMLTKHGFEIVRPETWSLAMQVTAFAGAEAICGPHGGGLLNLIYTDRDAILLELFGERTNPCFYSIAAGTGRRYAAHHATAVGDNLRVNPQSLSELLTMANDS
jgi:capsular polysaccharide biosynthesis protein